MKITSKLPALIISLLFLASCGTTVSTWVYVERMQGETESSTQLRAYVGDLVFSKYDYQERYEGRMNVSFEAKGFKFSGNDLLYKKTLLNGHEGGCSSDPISAGPGLFTPGTSLNYHCIYDSDANGMIDIAWVPMFGGTFYTQDGTMLPAWVSSSETTGTKKELIYQGMDGNTLRLRYREFFRDIVRPSYDQTVEYNLDNSKEISFRGLSISVIEADNQYLIYSINSGTLEL